MYFIDIIYGNIRTLNYDWGSDCTFTERQGGKMNAIRIRRLWERIIIIFLDSAMFVDFRLFMSAKMENRKWKLTWFQILFAQKVAEEAVFVFFTPKVQHFSFTFFIHWWINKRRTRCSLLKLILIWWLFAVESRLITFYGIGFLSELLISLSFLLSNGQYFVILVLHFWKIQASSSS